MTVTIAIPSLTGRRRDLPRWAAPLATICLVGVAYRTSIVTLVEGMQLDTPLAHLSLVPFISLGLAWIARRDPAGPDIRDRQLDWIVGVPLLAVAIVMNGVLPRELSWEFWVWRIDLLSLPLFVSGLVSLLFGVRALWKYRLALLFLFLAWPYPYNVVLTRWLGRFTELTIGALTMVLQWLPWAERAAGSDSRFVVVHESTPIQMSVASACSGANGLVGFLLVGLAFVLVVRGSRRRKLAWLATGALLVWVCNIARIMVIFWAARRYGESVAIEGFHPYVGLVVFNVAVLVMMLLMRPFGLRFGTERDDGERDGDDLAGGEASLRRAHEPTTLARPVRPAGAAMAVTAAVLVVATFNGDLREYDRVASSLGAARLTSFAQSQERPDGWELRATDTYDWSKRFFGDSSTWVRYRYSQVPGARAELTANVPITVDVIETSNRASFSAYGVEQCYTFHGHRISGDEAVDLGSGVVGGVVTWENVKQDISWTSLYWHWPIKTPGGTRYERITLIMQDRPGNTFTSPTIGPQLAGDLVRIAAGGIDDGSDAAINEQRVTAQRQFMEAFAREMVRQRTGDTAS